jgi:hypothetical protein
MVATPVVFVFQLLPHALLLKCGGKAVMDLQVVVVELATMVVKAEVMDGLLVL